MPKVVRKPVLKLRLLTAVFTAIVSTQLAAEPNGGDTYQSIRQSAKEEQALLAAAAGVNLLHSDRGSSYVTRIVGVPAEISAIVVYDETNLEPVTAGLSPYFGFRGNEELRFIEKSTNELDTVYLLRQFINGIETTADLRLRVDNTTAHVVRIDGWLYGPVGIESKSRVSYAAAIDSVIEHIESREAWAADQLDSISVPQNAVMRNAHQAISLYRPFGEQRQPALWWGIGIEIEAREEHSDFKGPYEWFYVSPDGTVTSWIEGNTSYTSPEALRGR